MNLEYYIEQAEQAGACKAELIAIRECDSIEEALKHPSAAYWACWYAENVAKGRWAEGEPAIMKSPRWAHHYATTVIKGRWVEGEPAIMQDSYLARHYAQYLEEHSAVNVE